VAPWPRPPRSRRLAPERLPRRGPSPTAVPGGGHPCGDRDTVRRRNGSPTDRPPGAARGRILVRAGSRAPEAREQDPVVHPGPRAVARVARRRPSLKGIVANTRSVPARFRAEPRPPRGPARRQLGRALPRWRLRRVALAMSCGATSPWERPASMARPRFVDTLLYRLSMYRLLTVTVAAEGVTLRSLYVVEGARAPHDLMGRPVTFPDDGEHHGSPALVVAEITPLGPALETRRGPGASPRP
jgi:hypothetical protein